jgi:hypothetical protein
MIDFLFLILAYCLTYCLVGFVFIEVFYKNLPIRIKFPLYFVLSLILSTFIVYFSSLLFGLTEYTVKISLIPFLFLSIPLMVKRFDELKVYLISHIKLFSITFLVVAVYFLALYPAILGKKDGYLVMSAVNWQDTALHMSITQSLTQGNFPPQAPYFSGQSLSYYYFSDLHSAIIALTYGKFFPRIFVYDNPLLVGVFVICVYSLAYEFSKSKKLSLVSATMAPFLGSFIFFNFIKSIGSGLNAFDLIRDNTYSMEYQKIFGMANMADYFLQNRPMMIGLSAMVAVILITTEAFSKKDLKLIFLSGLIGCLLLKFQFFCVLSCGLVFLSAVVVNLRKNNIKFIFKSFVLYTGLCMFFYYLLGTKSVNNIQFLTILKSSFHLGPWGGSAKSVLWYVEFILLNLGAPFLITILSIPFRRGRNNELLNILVILFVALPCLVTFTIAEDDMIKFFYLPIIVSCVVAPVVLRKIFKNRSLAAIAILFLVIVSSFSSTLTLMDSYLNKNMGYTNDEFDAGVWIRNNTPQKSVFITLPNVHSAPTDFAGRLRILSYTNWPYTHGFNIGEDNVFTRSGDVENLYKTGDIKQIEERYSPNYIYYGNDEKSDFPRAGELFDNNKNLKKVYNHNNIDIYEIL